MNEIERLKNIDVNEAIKKALVEQEKSKSLDEIERAMMDKLLPCPFCGGEATISDGGYSGEKFLARCRELSCPAASGFIRKTHDEAVAAWNRRAQPENKPTADAVPVVRGEWKRDIGDRHSSGEYRYCTACGGNAFHLYGMIRNYRYCPNCGADMRGDENERT